VEKRQPSSLTVREHSGSTDRLQSVIVLAVAALLAVFWLTLVFIW
jgi:hypothetical protein